MTADGRWYVVEQGDSVWRVSRAALRNAGAAANNVAVARYVDRVIEANRWLLPNPDLIHPGERFLMPTP